MNDFELPFYLLFHFAIKNVLVWFQAPKGQRKGPLAVAHITINHHLWKHLLPTP
jgi:hypothetical protein